MPTFTWILLFYSNFFKISVYLSKISSKTLIRGQIYTNTDKKENLCI